MHKLLLVKKGIYLLTILILCALKTFAQYPQYFSYDGENGLPSNEVYSIVQDSKGFIWIGCDAGLFKFDGVRYTAYKCQTQKSKSITGLRLSSSGKLYCYNFQSQLFYVQNDTLKEVKHNLSNIINLVSDNHSNIYASHNGGISRYSETHQQWKNYFEFNTSDARYSNQWFAKTIKGNLQNSIPFIYSKGIAQLNDSSFKQIHTTDLFQQSALGKYEIETYKNALWIFSKETDTIYHFVNNNLEQITHSKLNDILESRKITSVNALPDSCLWICTYNGIVRYCPQNNHVSLFYPDVSFSDCLIDKEGNYWFTTLQEGILRIPNLNFTVWGQYNKLSRITSSSTHIFFADQKGKIGKLNIENKTTELFSTKYDADIQSFDYDSLQNALLFNINNHLFQLKGNTLQEKNNDNIAAIKSVCNINGSVFTASSHGIYINGKKVSHNWARQIKHDTHNQCVWIATNSGLLKFLYKNKEWYLSETFFSDTQIISIDLNIAQNLIYALAFTGKIFAISNENKTIEIVQIPENILANKILCHNHNLYISSNAGIAVYSMHTQKLDFINHLSGLVSNNVQDMTITNSNLWIATVKGLQQIPLNQLSTKETPARIYLKNNYESSIFNYKLKYNESLILYPEVTHYNSNGQFEYAYRINQQEWIKRHATIEQLDIQNIPNGYFEIELKAIDYLGIDSENIILLKGFVKPPFWKTLWFILLIGILIGLVIFVIVKKRIAIISKREHQQTQFYQSQLTAIKAQMNPHFMYNTLNSIQALILQEDLKNTNLYLSKFSHLMRKVLDVSGREEISLQEETEILELYLSLEKLRFGNDFSYQIVIPENIDVYNNFIPPLLLQPFVENAIKHGLFHKKGKKNLSISLEKENQFFVYRIKDNGIGRKHSAEIKQRQKEKYTSFSTEALQKRLELLNSAYYKNFKITINDLHENNQPSGTEVVLKIN